MASRINRGWIEKKKWNVQSNIDTSKCFYLKLE